MSVNPLPATSGLSHASSNADMDDLEASVQSLHRIVASVTCAQLRIHTASDERQLLDKIEGELMTLSESFTALRYRRNQLAPINNLPDDVLRIIFSYANCETLWEMLEYLPLTWICRRWRVLAVDSPTLWNLIDLAYPKANGFLDEILRRSKGATLSVGQLGPKKKLSCSSGLDPMGWVRNVYLPGQDVDREYEYFKQSIVPILQRVKTLELTLPIIHWIDAFTVLRDATFSIHRCRFHEIRDLTWSPSQPTQHHEDGALFLSKVFNPHALQVDIQFQNLPLASISAFPVHRLRTLVLRRGGPLPSSDNTVTLQVLLAVLESCRFELESLKLYVLPPSTTTASSSQPRITMARLRTMVLASPADTTVLESISTPVLNGLEIDAQDAIAELCDMSHCMDFTTFPHMAVMNRNILGYREVPVRGRPRPNVALGILNCDSNQFNMSSRGASLSEWAGHLVSLELGYTHLLDVPALILKHAHMLRILDIQDCSDDVFSLLTDATACPNLERLKYKCRSRIYAPGKQLVLLARSRWDGGVGLEELTVCARKPIAKAHSDKLKKWVEKYNFSIE